MDTNIQNNTIFDDGTADEKFGLSNETLTKLKELDKPQLGYILPLDKIKLTKKYVKNCKKGENPFPKIKINKTFSKNPQKTKIDLSKPYDFPKGFIIPIYNNLEITPVLVDKMRRPKCYKPDEPIKEKSIKYGDTCYKDSQCIKGYCHGAFLNIKKGKCKKTRKTKNVAEDGECMVNSECKEGLVCKNNLGGLKLGKCKSKTKKLKEKSK